MNDLSTASTIQPAFMIEEGIPIPVAQKSERFGYAPTLRQLAVGQSFFVVATDKKAAGTIQNRLSASGRTIVARARREGPSPDARKKFVTRVMDGGVRIWRIV